MLKVLEAELDHNDTALRKHAVPSGGRSVLGRHFQTLRAHLSQAEYHSYQILPLPPQVPVPASYAYLTSPSFILQTRRYHQHEKEGRS
jgi:hypothetical protein